MNCTGCIYDGLIGEDRICCLRDHLKSDEDAIKYPENPGYGCSEKRVLCSCVAGSKIVLTYEQILVGIPDGYTMEV